MLKRPGKAVNLGGLFLAALWLDVVLWLLVLMGVESIHVPPNYQRMADLTYDFPYSHGLVASLAWSVVGFSVVYAAFRRQRLAALAVAGAVFSHFILDGLVHGPELPLLGSDSLKFGLGLWRQLPVALTVEVSLVVLGLWIYRRTVRLSRGRTIALVLVVSLVTVMTVMGQIARAPAPQPLAAAISSLVSIVVLSAVGGWIDRPSNPSAKLGGSE